MTVDTEPQAPRVTAGKKVQRGNRSGKFLSLRDPSSGLYGRLEGAGDVGDWSPGNGEPGRWANGAQSPCECEATDYATVPLIGASPKLARGKRERKKVSGVSRPGAAGWAECSKGIPGVPDQQSSSKGLHRQPTNGVSCFTSLGNDSQLLLKGRGRSSKRKENKLRKYREDIDRAFRRGWDHFISNLQSITL